MSQLVALAAAVGAAALFAYAVYSYWVSTRGKAARRIRMRLDALSTDRSGTTEASLIKDVDVSRNAWIERLVAFNTRADFHYDCVARRPILEMVANKLVSSGVPVTLA